MTEAPESPKPSEIKPKTVKETHSKWVNIAETALYGGIGTAQAAAGSVQLMLAERSSGTVTETISKVSEVLEQLGYNLSPEYVQNITDTLNNTLGPQANMHEVTAVASFTAAALFYGLATTSAYRALRKR